MCFSDMIIFFIKIVWRKGKIIFEKKKFLFGISKMFSLVYIFNPSFYSFTCHDICVNLHNKAKR